MPPQPSLPMSKAIGGYRIAARLGRGRLGVVFEAFDPVRQRKVALRVVREPVPDERGRSAGLAMLQDAARAAETLDHPHIAAVHEHSEVNLGTDDGSTGGRVRVLCIASALVDGESLASRLHDGTPIDPARACRWLTQILLALDHAHARGVVHADLKPANVLIADGDNVRLTDFGLTRGAVAADTDDSLLGSPAHLAPEQLLGDPVDARTDVFAAGILLYQMLTGRLPVEGGSATMMGRTLLVDPPPPSQHRAGLGTAFDSVVARALARRPEHRFTSADQFLQALNRAVFERAASTQDDDATMILPSAASRPTGVLAVPVDDWKLTAAAPLEQALITAVGPISRVLVRKALASATTFDAACSELAAQISEPAARQAFIVAVKRPATEDVAQTLQRAAESSLAPEPPSGRAAPSPGGSIDPQTLQNAIERLADDVGPMARIIGIRAAAEAGSREEFFRRIAAWVPTTEQRHLFLRQFGVGE